ncbi:MAG: ABC transporter substrate-binding protein [Ancrocorticia populi]|uniref:ABC transporter substrate-binding protein n=1 Tax=Ancrocorticia populi TaxID=2175228 RepID=UPI003F90CC54
MKKKFLAGATALALASTLAACGSSEPSADDPVTINYWGWVPGMQELVDEWNEEHPEIQVNYSPQSAGDDATFNKITTAARAGDGPDLVQADVKWVTSLIQYAKDVTDEAGEYEANYTEGAWGNVTIDGVTYGLPQDSGPMVMYYNAEKFDEYGLEVPTTWDEFAEQAEKVTTENPGTYLAGFSADDSENLQSYVQQAGGQWWSIGEDSWTVDMLSPESVKVAEFWQDLIENEYVSDTLRWDPTFYNELNNGTILSVVGAAWQAPLIADNAGDTSGDWAVAPAPQWEEGAQVSANNGGSQLLVLEDAEHPEEALEFANWLNTNVDGLLDLGLFPATSGAEIATPDHIEEFFGGDDVYGLLAEASDNIETQWLFPPTYSDLSLEMSDGIAKITSGSSDGLPELLEQLQQSSLDSFEQAGINAVPAE